MQIQVITYGLIYAIYGRNYACERGQEIRH